MKDEAQELKDLLLEFGTFLKEQGDDDWGDLLISAIDYVDADLKEAKRNIRRWFGGMGSLHDVSFCKDGVQLVEVNKKVYELQRKLYNLVSIYS